MKAKIGVIQLQVKKCLQPAEYGRDKKGFSQTVFRGGVALPKSFRFLASKTVREYASIVFKPRIVVICYSTQDTRILIQSQRSERYEAAPGEFALTLGISESWKNNTCDNSRSFEGILIKAEMVPECAGCVLRRAAIHDSMLVHELESQQIPSA